MGIQILVVEDNLALASVVRFNLEKAGYQVTLASDGEEGCQRAAETLFDLVITDVQMPVMNGYEFVEHLRSDPDYHGVPIIMVTAKGLELDLPKLHERFGVTASFSKPFSPQEVVETVAAHLPVA